MNRQPYATPPKWWPPKLSTRWIHWTRTYRRLRLNHLQKLTDLHTEGLEHIQQAVAAGHGVLITPNHSAHFDSQALYLAADRIGQPLYFMTAWQVFAMTGSVGRWMLQRMGCFSIDRESNDRQAMKQSLNILQNESHPLVIFPEGDIYHSTDLVTPFREGAAAIAMAAAKRSDRDIVVIPCGIKFWYVDDPTPRLLKVMTQLEERVLLRPQQSASLVERIYRLADAVVALKELDYMGAAQGGDLKIRMTQLAEHILRGLESRYEISRPEAALPDRVKTLRQKIIPQLENGENSATREEMQRLQQEMEDLFFVMQLYSYPSRYVRQQPTIERLAETVDKLEEDVLQRDLPSLRGRRRVEIRFGPSLPVAHAEKNRRDAIRQLTLSMHGNVQKLLDQINARSNEGNSRNDGGASTGISVENSESPAQPKRKMLAETSSSDR